MTETMTRRQQKMALLLELMDKEELDGLLDKMLELAGLIKCEINRRGGKVEETDKR
jgi:hypothetical protein